MHQPVGTRATHDGIDAAPEPLPNCLRTLVDFGGVIHSIVRLLT